MGDGPVQPTMQTPQLKHPSSEPYMRQYDALLWYQDRANEGPNVTAMPDVNGCGRGLEARCLCRADALVQQAGQEMLVEGMVK